MNRQTIKLLIALALNLMQTCMAMDIEALNRPRYIQVSTKLAGKIL